MYSSAAAISGHWVLDDKASHDEIRGHGSLVQMTWSLTNGWSNATRDATQKTCGNDVPGPSRTLIASSDFGIHLLNLTHIKESWLRFHLGCFFGIEILHTQLFDFPSLRSPYPSKDHAWMFPTLQAELIRLSQPERHPLYVDESLFPEHSYSCFSTLMIVACIPAVVSKQTKCLVCQSKSPAPAEVPC